MKHSLIISILLLTGINLLMSQTTFTINSELKAISITDKSNSDIITTKEKRIESSSFEVMESMAIQAFTSAGDKIILDNFPVSYNLPGTIELERVAPIFDANTQWFRNTKDGLLPAPAPDMVSFRGKIAGQEKSTVYINYTDGEISGLIVDENEAQFEIRPDIMNKGLHSITTVNWEEFSKQYTLDNDVVEGYSDAVEHKGLKYQKDGILSTELLEAPIAIEAEFYFYELMQSDYNRAATYIANVMTLASRIYEDNINVALYLPYVLIHETADTDPYINREELARKLYIMDDVWKEKQVDRAIVVLFADLNKQSSDIRTAGISYGGAPYKGSLCNNNRGYCVLGIKGFYQYPTTYYTWDVSVACHEMGHNFSGPHTHNCFWEPNMIDTCITSTKPYESDGCLQQGDYIPRPGTIMSYCHLTNSTRSVQLYFHDRMKPVIRIAANTAKCINPPADPMIHLLSPLGDTEYKAGKVQEIRWTASKVNFIDLYYSDNSGADWNKIATKVRIADSIYEWKMPLITSDEVLVRINDFYNPAIADTSILNFSILVPGIIIVEPEENEKIGQKEVMQIYFDRTLVDTVTVMFSSDGGSNWEVIASDVVYNFIDWEVPDIESSDCLIRVIDKNDDGVQSDDLKFEIGAESLTITRPNGDELYCVGDSTLITWESEFVRNVWLYYSTNSGESWKRVRLSSMDGEEGSFKWYVPNRLTTNALISASIDNDKENLIDISDSEFIIDSCLSDVHDNLNSPDGMLEVRSIVPHPVSKDADIIIYSGSKVIIPMEISLADNSGRKMTIQTGSKNLIPGINNVHISLGELAQGNYFLIINAGQYTVSYPLKVVR